MHFDLIVIGAGLAGLMAAKTACEAGARVLVVGKGTGAVCLFTQGIDLLGVIPRELPMEEGIRQWIEANPHHPYARVTWPGVQGALSSFLALFPGPYTFEAIGEGNCLVPTGAGTYRPTYLVPTTMCAGIAFPRGSALIVGFRGFKDYSAAYVGHQFQCRSVTLPLPEEPHQGSLAAAMARLLEKRSFREAAAREIRRHLHAETRVGLPAILGLRDPAGVLHSLEDLLGIQVFEMPILPPSIPGLRIFNRFQTHLLEQGATVLLGHAVVSATVRKGYCTEIQVAHPPLSNAFRADRYLLATGRFIGGGLLAREDRIVETVFDLPLFQPESRDLWFQKSFLSEHLNPVHHAGVMTDTSLHPVDAQGERLLHNVWVAGTILAHHHCIGNKSREGIELATGWMAARRALAA